MTDKDDLLAAVQKDEAEKVRTILDRNPLILRMRTPNGTLVLTAIYNGPPLRSASSWNARRKTLSGFTRRPRQATPAG